MTFDGIRVDHAALTQASGDLRGSANRIRARLDELDQDLKPLSQRWSGEARASHDAARSEWQRAMAEMLALLEQVSTAVTESNQAYRAADLRGAERFS